MSLPSVDDTGELQQLAEAIERMKSDPRRPGPLDAMLLSIAIGAATVVIGALLLLTFAANNFPVEPGRILLTTAAAGTCVAPVLIGLYGLNRTNRRRHQAMMEKLGSIAEHVRKLAEARHAAAIGYSCSFQTIESNLGLLAAQVEQLDQRLAKFEPPEEVPAGAKDIAMRSFETGRRIGRREADG